MRKTALSVTRVELALRNALESEAELTESDSADERLLSLVGLRRPHTTPQPKAKTDEQLPSPNRPGRPGKRSPVRIVTGQQHDETQLQHHSCSSSLQLLLLHARP